MQLQNFEFPLLLKQNSCIQDLNHFENEIYYY